LKEIKKVAVQTEELCGELIIYIKKQVFWRILVVLRVEGNPL